MINIPRLGGHSSKAWKAHFAGLFQKKRWVPTLDSDVSSKTITFGQFASQQTKASFLLIWHLPNFPAKKTVHAMNSGQSGRAHENPERMSLEIRLFQGACRPVALNGGFTRNSKDYFCSSVFRSARKQRSHCSRCSCCSHCFHRLIGTDEHWPVFGAGEND